ncbi:E3 ISG15--protein ligase HERC5 [Pelomyxa schiedti]|nr:E3 ISG15--protein ligase HERC5 [Pelomyxa schiedti]
MGNLGGTGLLLALNVYNDAKGRNTSGQLGLGNTSFIDKPTKIPNLHGAIALGCGRKHSLVVTRSGAVFSFGDNSFGQLARKELQSSVPLWVSSLFGVPVVSCAVGDYHCICISVCGNVYCWGSNQYGQLGLGVANRRLKVAQVNPYLRGKRIIAAACGSGHSLLLSEYGVVYSFGKGKYGQLGHGNAECCSVPTAVSYLNGYFISKISCGREHSIALKYSESQASHLFSWGLNNHGQLGTGDTNSRHIPTTLASFFGGKLQPFMDCGSGHSVISIAGSIIPMVLPPLEITTVDTRKITQLLTEGNTAAVKKSIIETFSSPSCINASFLLPGGKHFETSPSFCGINFVSLRHFYSIISSNQLRDCLLGAMDSSINQIDVVPLLYQPETLRILLILLEHPIFCDKASCPFELLSKLTHLINSLSPEMKSILESWWTSYTEDDFGRLVNIFLTSLKHWSSHQENFEKCDALPILKVLYTVNEKKSIISFQRFYCKKVCKVTPRNYRTHLACIHLF